MNPAYLLIIEDDEIIARTIERSLRSDEFKITVSNRGVEGLKIARRSPPNLVILDIVMPGMDGYTVCREMRGDPILSNVPILFLTAKIRDDDKINGFLAGGDDYLTKPFNLDELILRVRAILRRTVQTSSTIVIGSQADAEEEGELPVSAPIAFQQIRTPTRAEVNRCIVVGDYALDTGTYELKTPHRGKVRVTPVQYDLLYHLMGHVGQIFSPARLLDEVWGYPTDAGSPDLVRVHIKNLREQVEVNPRSPQFICTVPGYGYTVASSCQLA